jgi:hypothetical protein
MLRKNFVNSLLALCLLNGKKSVFIPNVHQEVGQHGLRWLKKKRERSALRSLFGIGIMNTLAKKWMFILNLVNLSRICIMLILKNLGKKKYGAPIP